jgi:hypothetical protein
MQRELSSLAEDDPQPLDVHPVEAVDENIQSKKNKKRAKWRADR